MIKKGPNRPASPRPLLAFYGDDFTGSTDALEQLANAGLRAVLFVELPDRKQLAAFGNPDAIGLAGRTRSLPSTELAAELRPGLKKFKALRPRHVHYKVCSTFDSSPETGNIGRVIDVATGIFNAPFVPVLVGAPSLGRYCVFGNLFARFGIGSSGPIYRLDRHPAISRHPVTPMTEADLLLHLQKQTRKHIGLFDILKVNLPPKEAHAALRKLAAEYDIVFFDALCPEHLPRIGRMLDSFASNARPLFSVGSSAIEVALGSLWSKRVRLKRTADPVSKVLVASGSCSPVTNRQIDTALRNGFAEVRLRLSLLFSAQTAVKEFQRASGVAIQFLRSGRSVIVHTGGASPSKTLAKRAGNRTAEVFGAALGSVVRAALEEVSVPRFCIAGGDTASFAIRSLGAQAVEMVAPLVIGAPICRVYAPGSPADGLQAVCKGGQVGGDDFFTALLKGKA